MLSGLAQARSTLRKCGLTTLTALVMLGGASTLGSVAWAKESAAISQVSLAELPEEAQITERAIRAGGPFPYSKDGTVFGNRERILPVHPRGYYREYTVKTLGTRGRGARRIVCGGLEVRRPESCYYTADHYASFRRITTP